MKTRRDALMLGAGLGAAFALPAWAAAADDSVLRFGSASTGDHTYDPRIAQSGAEEQIIAQVFDRLIAFDGNGHAQPSLARSWQIADDHRSITLDLRDDVIFHDGSRFDAAAVKFTFDSIVDPKTGSMGAADVIGPYVGSDLLSAHKIRLRYKRPFSRILSALADNKASIVSPTAALRLGVTRFGEAPVGTGPYRFVSWEKGVQVILAHNPHYRWAPAFMPNSPPAIAKVIHRFIPNGFTRAAALDAGEIDACELLPSLDIRRMTSGRQFRALVGTTMGVPFGFSLNTSRGPFQDLRVRQAFMHAIDRHWISQNLLFGVIDPAWGPLSSSSPEYWPGVEKYYPFNLTAAAKLLDQAGWRMGADGIRHRGDRRLALYLPILLEPAMGVVLQAHARRAGFDLQIEQVTRERQQQHIFANDYDLLSLRWVYADAGVLDVPFLSKNVPAPGRFSFNWSRYQNPALDAALTSAAAASPDKRRDQYGQVQRLIMDQAIFLPVHEEIYDLVYSNRIAGLRLTHGNAQAAFAGVRFVG